MSKELRYDLLYMDIASRCAEMSHAVRKKVGCVIVKDGNIIAMGWNGKPAGMDNNCEDTVWHQPGEDVRNFPYTVPDDERMSQNIKITDHMTATARYKLVTKPEVSHAEENALAKIAKSNSSSLGATAYVTLEPCMHCAKLLYSAGITRVVVKESYVSHEGTVYLTKLGVTMKQL
jgi:dCMP deaminase